MADPAGAEYAAAAGALPDGMLVGGQSLELAPVGLSAGHRAGAGLRCAEFLGFCKRASEPGTKRPEPPCRVQFTSILPYPM